MQTSNAQFENIIAHYADHHADLTASWNLCTVSNSTYTACNVEEGTEEFAVTSLNPSALEVDIQTFKVPPSTSYDVQVFDEAEGWQSAKSTLLCYDYLENNNAHSSYEDCNLHVKAKAKAQQITYMKLKANFDSAQHGELATDSDTISTETSSLKYTG